MCDPGREYVAVVRLGESGSISRAAGCALGGFEMETNVAIPARNRRVCRNVSPTPHVKQA